MGLLQISRRRALLAPADPVFALALALWSGKEKMGTGGKESKNLCLLNTPPPRKGSLLGSRLCCYYSYCRAPRDLVGRPGTFTHLCLSH